MTEKMDMSLDDIVKMDGISGSRRGRGAARGGAGRGSKGPGARGTSTGRGRGASAGRFTGRVQRSAPYSRSPKGADKWKHDLFEGPQGRAGGGSHLLVSNLDFGVTDADIQELFAEFGTLKKAAVHYDRSGRSLGTADVVFSNFNEANAAMKQYNGVPLDGRAMKIQLVSSGGSGTVASPRSTGAASDPRTKRGSAGGRGRGAPGRGSRTSGRLGGGGARQEKVKPTAEDLDADLDSYISKA
ncbi:Aly/REF export factor 2 [Halotydeus destructor]|nr:Aly/REF export factor 2 [Halotydeus destructor]